MAFKEKTERVTKEELNRVVRSIEGRIQEQMDRQRIDPVKALFALEGITFFDTLGGVLSFEKKRKGPYMQEDEDPFPTKMTVKYSLPKDTVPIFQAELVMEGLFIYDSSITVLCADSVPGYTLMDEERFGNSVWYRFFNNDPGNPKSGFREQLRDLSGKLTSRAA